MGGRGWLSDLTDTGGQHFKDAQSDPHRLSGGGALRHRMAESRVWMKRKAEEANHRVEKISSEPAECGNDFRQLGPQLQRGAKDHNLLCTDVLGDVHRAAREKHNCCTILRSQRETSIIG